MAIILTDLTKYEPITQTMGLKPLVIPLQKSSYFIFDHINYFKIEKVMMDKQHELESFEKKEFVDSMYSVLTSLCLRLGNIHFLEKQIENVAHDLFQSKSLKINELLQEISNYCKVRFNFTPIKDVLISENIKNNMSNNDVKVYIQTDISISLH